MKYRFTKMHGISNDYIYFNCFEQDIPDPAALSVRMSPRHSSVGADGIVLICPSDCADARMRMFNADGSEGRMCGNAGLYARPRRVAGAASPRRFQLLGTSAAYEKVSLRRPKESSR